jgi:predicted ATP-grasp superfamily ATP-dependent carboligase
VKVLITGASWKIGIASAYILAKSGHTVIGTDEYPLPFKVHSKHLKSYYTHAPYNDNRFYEDILSIIKKENPDVLIPLGGTGQISFNKNEIKKYVNILVPDYESYCTVYDKKKTYNLCKESGVAVPVRYTDNMAERLLKTERYIKLVIKPDFDIGGSRGLAFVSNLEELEKARKSISSKFGNYIIEEFIPGSSSMRAVQLIFNKENKISSYFILKKIHQWPVTGGITAYAESSHEWDLLEFVAPLFNKCSWEGPVELEIIIDERDCKPKLVEINPRFAGSIAFAIQCGVNFPLVVCLATLNNHYLDPTNNYSEGKFYIHLSYYLKAVMKEYKDANNKTAFLFQVINELKRNKVGTSPDKKDFLVYLVKAITDLKNRIANMNFLRVSLITWLL